MAADDNLNDDQFNKNTPTHAVHKVAKLGRLEIKHHEGDGYFHTLDRKGVRRSIHRDMLTFVKPPKKRSA